VDTVIALVLALAATLGPPVAILEQRHTTVAPGRGRRPPPCEPYASVCRSNTIYTCIRGRWRRGLDCARAGHPSRVTVCEVVEGLALCTESGGASPFPGSIR